MPKKNPYGRVQLPIIAVAFLVLLCYWLLGKREGEPSSASSGAEEELKQEHPESRRKSRSRLVILVLSAPENLKERYVIRKTWLSIGEGEQAWRHWFAIGTAELEDDVRLTLESEQAKYKDLLLLPKLRDSYDVLSKKLLQALAALQEHHSFDYLFKCDDDSFVLVGQLLQSLDQWQGGPHASSHLYWGFFNGKASIKKGGPWREPDWIFCDYYLPYALGGGYLLSSSLVRYIVDNKAHLKLFHSEDVSVGLWLSPVANIHRKHDVRFDTEFKSRGCSNQYIVTHKRGVDDMKNLWDNYLSTGSLCSKEFHNRPGYEYNWSLPPSRCCARTPGIP